MTVDPRIAVPDADRRRPYRMLGLGQFRATPPQPGLDQQPPATSRPGTIV